MMASTTVKSLNNIIGRIIPDTTPVDPVENRVARQMNQPPLSEQEDKIAPEVAKAFLHISYFCIVTITSQCTCINHGPSTVLDLKMHDEA